MSILKKSPKKVKKCKFCGGRMHYLQFCHGDRPPDYALGGFCTVGKADYEKGCGAHLYGHNGEYRWFTHKEWEEWVNEDG